MLHGTAASSFSEESLVKKWFCQTSNLPLANIQVAVLKNSGDLMITHELGVQSHSKLRGTTQLV